MSSTTSNSNTTGKCALSAGKKTVSRRRSSKGRLRKHATLDGTVVVEEPILFTLPKSGDNNHDQHEREKDTIGEGCYISCTVHRTRYYGVLVDQDTLTAATDLYWRNEADSLNLNRRMKHFYHLQQQLNQQRQHHQGGLKRPRDHITEDATTTTTRTSLQQQQQQQQQVRHQRLNSSQKGQIQNLKKIQNAQRAELHKLHQTQLASYGNKVQNHTSITISGRSHLEQLYALQERQREEKDDQEKLFLEQSKTLWESFRHPTDTTTTTTLLPQEKPPDLTIPNSAVENGGTAKAIVGNEAQEIQPATDTANKKSDLHDEMQDVRQVQKFLFLPPDNKTDPGYRTLLATYANVNAAAEDNPDKLKLISKACNDGGNFVGKYYYQFMESNNNIIVGTQSLENEPETQKRTDIKIHTSLNVAAFFQSTTLPPWFPLSNIDGFSQNKVLSILKLKKTKESGEVEFDGDGEDLPMDNPYVEFETEEKNYGNSESNPVTAETKVYRVGVLGGGIAGLACAAELLRLAELDKHTKNEIKHLQVILLEGRDRVGGRLHTDYDSLDCAIDLGAGWIHGIDGNPITDLAKEAGLTLVPTEEDVKLISGNMQLIDNETDKKISSLFDKLLDEAMDQCWEHNELQEIDINTGQQRAIRWYGSALTSKRNGNNSEPVFPKATDVPIYRQSTDISVDHALGLVTCSSLTEEELRLLHWHTKNVEYALGADINSLSMKFLSAEEDNAFEGKHVMLREGYSKISELLLQRCLRRKKNFSLILNFPIGIIEYSRKHLRNTLEGPRSESYEETKSCRVTSQDGKSSYDFDFLVCTLPLGVLKHSIAVSPSSANQSAVGSPADGILPIEDASKRLIFKPELPIRKRDAIEAVGFGILNKIYLQFPFAFWRQKDSKANPLFREEQYTFGNVSGVNPHIYVFYDMGMIMSSVHHREKCLESPAVLLTLVSGCEAVRLEQHSEDDVVREVLLTLKSIFTDVEVPQPTRVKLTMWGSDEFSRGCYSFLPPGATNEDHAILQLPLNGNGDKYSDQSFDTMRLFWAGEHTSSLHPSMAHGALLSGIRAAEEVINEMETHGKDRAEMLHNDTPVPVTIYRSRYPLQPLACQLCHKTGSRKEEGALISFQRGVKVALVHLQCILNSSEVECVEDSWKNVFKAVYRGKQIKCSKCRTLGATIGCNVSSCPLSYHFSCCEEEGWSFEHDGKAFLCKNHRGSLLSGNSTEIGTRRENGANSSTLEQNPIQHDLFTSALQKSRV